MAKPNYFDWIKTVPVDKRDTMSYDLKQAYEKLPYELMVKYATSNEHLPDTYKKPIHPTFSDKSIYSNKNTPGGKWKESSGKWSFTPSEYNIKNLGGVEKYKEWWNKNNDDGSVLIIPQKGVINNRLQKNSGLKGIINK